MLTLNPQELGAVLTGLRMLQVNLQHMGETVALRRILTDDGAIEPIDLAAIDGLCERINCTPEIPLWAISVTFDGGSTPSYGTRTFVQAAETEEKALEWAKGVYEEAVGIEINPIESWVGNHTYELCVNQD